MESGPDRVEGQSPVEYMRARQLFCINKIKERDSERLRIQKELAQKEEEKRRTIRRKNQSKKKIAETSNTTIPVEDAFNWILEEYNNLFSKIEEYKRKYVLGGEIEMRSLMDLIFVGSLLDDAPPDVLNKLNVWRKEVCTCFGEKLKSEIEVEFVKKLRGHFVVCENDSRNHSIALEEGFNNILRISKNGYEKVKPIVDQIIKDRNSRGGYHYDVNLQAKMLRAEWPGGSLTNWLKVFPNKVVNELSLQLDVRHTAWRLTESARHILRGIVKRIMHFHRKGVACGEFRSSDIIIGPDYNVKFVKTLHFSNNNSKRSDMESISKIIKEMIGDDPDMTPPDVDNLDSLLTNYSNDRADVIYNHPCLWTPMETVQNLILIRLTMGASMNSDRAWINTSRVEEENSDWTMYIKQHVLYMAGFTKWVEVKKKKIAQKIKEIKARTGCEVDPETLLRTNPGRGNLPVLSAFEEFECPRDYIYIEHPGLLTFLRVCFLHIHQHRAQKSSPAKSVAVGLDPHRSFKEGSCKLLKTEAEIYIFYPKYSSHFVYENRQERMIMDIIKTEY